MLVNRLHSVVGQCTLPIAAQEGLLPAFYKHFSGHKRTQMSDRQGADARRDATGRGLGLAPVVGVFVFLLFCVPSALDPFPLFVFTNPLEVLAFLQRENADLPFPPLHLELGGKRLAVTMGTAPV